MQVTNVQSVLVVGKVDKTRLAEALRPSERARGTDQTSAVGDIAKAGPEEQTRALALSNASGGAEQLSPEQQELVDKLAARDREVRQHEEAHARVGGSYAGQPSYTYQSGPDGKRYAVGGEVPIDIAPVSGDPEATIEKMRVVKAAALAPAEPSAADRRIAQLAETQKLEAMAELNRERADARAQDLASTAGLIAPDRAEPGSALSIAA